MSLSLLLLIEFVFLCFIFIIYREVIKNKNLDLAKNFIFVIILISLVKITMFIYGINKEKSYCNFLNDLYGCKNN